MSKGKTRKRRQPPFVEISWATESQLRHLDIVDGIARRMIEAALARAKGPKPPSEEDTASAVWTAEEFRHREWLKVRVTPDLPEDVMIHAFLHRMQEEDLLLWTARVRALGGPRMRPAWLAAYLLDQSGGVDRPIDGRVRAALILVDQADRARRDE